jgi:hypothetical protein
VFHQSKYWCLPPRNQSVCQRLAKPKTQALCCFFLFNMNVQLHHDDSIMTKLLPTVFPTE